MRLRRYEIEPAFLKELLVVDRIRSAFVVTKGVPEDADLIRVYVDEERHPGVISLVFSHTSFEEVYEGQSLPVYTSEAMSFNPLPAAAVAWQEEHELLES